MKLMILFLAAMLSICSPSTLLAQSNQRTTCDSLLRECAEVAKKQREALKEAQKEIAIINADIKNLKALLDVYKKDLALVEEALAKLKK